MHPHGLGYLEPGWEEREDRFVEGRPRSTDGRQTGPEAAGEESLAFLLTDIEGSMDLWEHDFHAMADALERHDRIVLATVEAAGGTVVRSKGEGDSVFAVFPAPAAAIACAVELQRRLAGERWPTVGPVQVRAAVDFGRCQRRDGDYLGPVIGRCARLRAAAHGGQILLSDAAARAAELPSGCSTKDLGVHKLRGVKQPERVLQLDHPGLTTDFPPLNTAAALSHNLPSRTTAFVGRDQEVRTLRDMLGRRRLVTVLGPGGIGKTSVALEVARKAAPDHPDGVWFVDLTPITTGRPVAGHVLSSIGVSEEPGQSPETMLTAHLGSRRSLLLLDTCEHVCEEVAGLVTDLLASCERLVVLATSRERLMVPGEGAYQLGPLPTETPAGLSDAARLFVERATEADRSFDVTDENRPAIEDICARVGAMPLAIELAAARAAVMGLDEIRRRLDRRLSFLTGGSRGVHERQKSLRATIDWSYELLADHEKRALAWMSVAPAGFSLDAANRLVELATGSDVDALDVLHSLVAKSLVSVDRRQGTTRFRILDTVREYGQEVLDAWDERLSASRAHAAWCARLVTEAGPALRGPGQAEWLTVLEDEHDGVRQGLRFAIDQRDADLLAALAPAWVFWHKRGHLAEGREWLAESAGALDPQMHPPLIAELQAAASVLAYAQADYAAAEALAQGVAGAGDAVPAASVALATETLGLVARAGGAYVRAAQLLQRALEVRREIGDLVGVGDALRNLGLVAEDQGRFDDAAELFFQSLDVRRRVQDTAGIALSLTSLGYVAGARGAHSEGADLCEESVRLFREAGDRRGMALALNDLGLMLSGQGLFERARLAHLQSYRIRCELGENEGRAECLVGLAHVAAGRGDHERAVALASAASRIRAGLMAPSPVSEQRLLADVLDAARSVLGAERFAEVWTAAGDRDVEPVDLARLDPDCLSG